MRVRLKLLNIHSSNVAAVERPPLCLLSSSVLHVGTNGTARGNLENTKCDYRDSHRHRSPGVFLLNPADEVKRCKKKGTYVTPWLWS